MDPTSITQILILIVLLVLSAFFSSAETALTTVNIHRIRSLADAGDQRAKRILSLRENPEKMLSAILIGNNIVNLTASSLTTTLAIRLSSRMGAGSNSSTIIGAATGILTLIILVFGEITPKTTATVQNEKMALVYSGAISLLTLLLTPLIFLVNAFSALLCRIIGIDLVPGAPITEQELRTIVNVSSEEGVIEEEEKQMINNVVDFGDSVAKDIMLPRIDMVFANVEMSLRQINDIFVRYQYSRLPVYEETKDKVIGILNMKDLYFYQERHRDEDFDIRKILREPFFTYEFQKTSVLMNEMRKEQVSFAIVLDEYGSTAGLVTMEDLIEEIIGDIRDEFDNEQPPVRKIGENEYEIDGGTHLEEINEALGTEIESENYDSIGGHIIELLDHLPEEGEAVREGDYLYSVLKMDQNRISLIYLKVEGSKDL